MAAQFQFFIGKGGVGKSTVSALTALNLAHCGRETLLVSMDPAHNQRDIFRRPFFEKPKQVVKKLFVKEVDTDYWMKVYLRDSEAQLKKVYSYQGAFNLDGYFKILKYSPTLEEYALLLAFENVISAETDREVIVFDMPPTALTLRFFSLPFTALIWLRELLRLREKILKKKEIITRIKVGSREIERDRVSSRLTQLIDHHRRLRDLFVVHSTLINLVVNLDPLSLAEAVRFRQRLADLGMVINSVILNKAKNNRDNHQVHDAFKDLHIRHFPESSRELYGIESLYNYIFNLIETSRNHGAPIDVPPSGS